MRSAFILAIGTMATACGVASAGVIFTDSFETGMANWSGWLDVSWYPGKAGGCNNTKNCWGPWPLFQIDPANHPHTGVQCARQEQAQPYWYGSKIAFPLTLPDDKTIRLSVWQFEDASPTFLQPATNPPQPGDPRRYHDHDQVQGWVALTGDYYEDETEFLAIGVHAHWASPEPVLDWWHNVAWSTAMEGWNLTSPLVPRAQGFRHLEIWVHPYTGNVGDVEFFINGAKVGEGSRTTVDGAVVPINSIALGSSPAHMSEDYISNTYEYFWYDDVKLSVGVLCDFDDDGDVDLADFGHFQSCFNGPNRPPAQATGCDDADVDSDGDVDLADFGVFQGCFNGPNRPAGAGCQ
jgi:hypothetical protein